MQGIQRRGAAFPGGRQQLPAGLDRIGRQRVERGARLAATRQLFFHARLERGLFRFGHHVQFDGLQQQVVVAVRLEKGDGLVQGRQQFGRGRGRRPGRRGVGGREQPPDPAEQRRRRLGRWRRCRRGRGAAHRRPHDLGKALDARQAGLEAAADGVQPGAPMRLVVFQTVGDQGRAHLRIARHQQAVGERDGIRPFGQAADRFGPVGIAGGAVAQAVQIGSIGHGGGTSKGGAPAQARGGAAAGLSGRRVALLNPSQRGAPLQAATVCHQVFRWSLGRQTARGPREFPAVKGRLIRGARCVTDRRRRSSYSWDQFPFS
ncbi:hypothetical protein WJ967_17090 [Achromobacter xylosoxidans]